MKPKWGGDYQKCEMPDNELLAIVKNERGPRQTYAIQALAWRYRGILNTVASRISYWMTPDEKIAAAYNVIWKMARKYDPVRSFPAYLSGVTRNQILQEWHDYNIHCRSLVTSLDAEVSNGEEGMTMHGDVADPNSPNPLETMMSEEEHLATAKYTKRLMRMLSPLEKVVYIGLWVYGFSYEMIAEQIAKRGGSKITTKTVDNAASRIRLKISAMAEDSAQLVASEA